MPGPCCYGRAELKLPQIVAIADRDKRRLAACAGQNRPARNEGGAAHPAYAEPGPMAWFRDGRAGSPPTSPTSRHR